MRYQEHESGGVGYRKVEAMMVFDRGIRLAIGAFALCFASATGAQESLDTGKSPAQLFASDCAICHKSPQGLTKSGRLFGLDGFLREHYTASRESAAAIAAYLQAADSAPTAPARGKAAKKGAPKGDDKTKASEKKPDAGKSGDAKSGDAKSGDTKPAESKPSEPKPSEPKPSEPKSTETKPAETKPAEAKPGDAKASEPKPAQSPKAD